MADDVTLPATGEVVATDDIGGRQFQLVKMVHGADGIAHLTSNGNPLPTEEKGELVEAIEALRFAVQSLTRSIGFALPSTQGWPIMEVRQPTAANLNVTLASTTISSGTVTTVSTLTNQSQQGGLATNDYIPTLMRMGADNLRRNISVT
jgi:hypothetical protein